MGAGGSDTWIEAARSATRRFGKALYLLFRGRLGGVLPWLGFASPVSVQIDKATLQWLVVARAASLSGQRSSGYPVAVKALGHTLR
jgi:hypothetical protein